MARPSIYTEEIAKTIVEKTATSAKSLKTICAELNIPVRTVLDWLASNDTFSQMYARGKEEQADFLAEEIIEIADDSSMDEIPHPMIEGAMMTNHEHINRSRLRVDARKWVAAKLKPRKYADRVQQDVTITEITSRIVD